MVDIAEIVDALGGMAQKRQLVARGARDLDLTRAVRDGSVIRARQGWYTTLPESDLRVRAVRVGGRLTGISAIEQWGGWVLGEHPLHVSVPFNAARLRTQRNRFRRLQMHAKGALVLHWDDPELADRGSVTSVGLADALRRVVLDESMETAVAALDWASHSGLIDEIDLHQLARALPANRRQALDRVDAACESLPESLARTRLKSSGHRVVSQVPVGESERIDLVIDDIVALEVDGEAYHADRFEQDRRKDLTITLAGFHAMRPTARMVFSEWRVVLRGIEAAIAARAPAAFGNSGSQRSHPLAFAGNTRMPP